tara:strand:- start:240 stop:497 length:258 start_codon:yes stop_codon:yes gene_type:complete
MQRKTLYWIIGLIWVALIFNSIFIYDYYKLNQGYCEDGLVGTCVESLLASEILSTIFWGTFSTVLLLFVYDAVAILNHIDMKDEE